MSYTIPVSPRHERLEAFQLVEGETTATQIRDFAGDRANVGVANGDDSDIRWIHIKTWRGWEELGWGDWILRDPAGQVFEWVTGEGLRKLYSPADADAAATLRTRDVNDPRNAEAGRLAKSLARSLRDS